jgi:hypothetical protein
MPRPRLHLDADTSIRALQRALTDRGHDVTRTPNDWMPADAVDEVQILGATAQGRCLFTFNVAHFPALAEHHPRHAGVLLAAQSRWSLGDVIAALDRALSSTEAADWVGQVRWLNRWRV